jgi:hypothetical protein
MKDRQHQEEPARTIAAIGGVAVIGYVVLAVKLGVAFAIPVGVIGCVAAAIVLRGPLGRALLGQSPAGDPAVAEQVTGQLLGEMDDLRNRVQELEERVDFSERLLASHSRPPEQ